jgi:hypothetical protein
MISRIERNDVVDARTGAVAGFHETGIVSMGGREFAAGGAHLDPDNAIGYPKFEREYAGATGRIQSWSGEDIGTCRIVSMWPVRSFMGSHMCQIRATINGRSYTGRGMGNGMIWRGKAAK